MLPTMGGQTALNLAKALSEVRSATHYALECMLIEAALEALTCLAALCLHFPCTAKQCSVEHSTPK